MGRQKNQKIKTPARKLKKDPGVPKLPNLKARNELRKLSSSTRPRTYPHHGSEDTPMATETSLASLAATLADPLVDPSSSTQTTQPSLDSASQAQRQYIRTLHRVIEQSDVVILVLDARDPDGCRSRLVEEEVRRRESEGKKLIFVLNKIDLVPQENALAWLRYLRHTAPTVPFRSSTQLQSTNLRSRSSPVLMNLIKSCKNAPASKIVVGVVGYPNVGKSSLINSLKRSKVCAVAAEAGWTRDLQSIQIERGIRIIDSPGVVFDDDPSSAQARSGVLLRNVLKVENVDDPLAVVEEIVARTERETLQKIYKLPEWNTMLEFLTMLALSTGRLLKGGTPDLLSTARAILQDWNANKIPYFSVPPVVHPSSLPSNVSGAENVGDVAIVQGGFGPAFNLGELYGEAMQQDDDGLQDVNEGAMDEDGNEMESDDLRPVIPRKRSLSLTPDLESTPTAVSALGKQALNPSDTGTHRHTVRGPVGKRPKPTYDAQLEPYERETMGIANPLGRKAMKENLKKERKAARRAARNRETGMAIDDVGEALEFTFRVPRT